MRLVEMTDSDMESLRRGYLRYEAVSPHEGDESAADFAGQWTEGDLASVSDGVELAGSRSRRKGRRWAGAPERRPWVLPALLAAVAGLGVVAGIVATSFVSPAQQAASARPPSASLITAKVRFGVLPVLLSLRAAVENGHPVQIGPPSDLDGSLPVVTSAAVSAGQRVQSGQLI